MNSALVLERHSWFPRLAACALAVLLLGAASRVHASQFVWDSDGDGIDDRIESVNALGYQFSFVGSDTTAHQRIAVTRQSGSLVYGIYVVYGHTPTASDVASLATLALPVLHRYEALPVLHSAGTFVQVAAAAALPGVVRVEAVPVLYPLLRENSANAGVRDAAQRVFPTWYGTGGGDGSGTVVAFLDTGINDQADGAYPGHESLAGRFVGGATFYGADSSLDTQPSDSMNPEDHGDSGHGTHIAGIAVGSGGASAFARGVAPGAKFVDVKVLSDAGMGLGVAEGLDWCIHNRSRAWGPANATGIQVINLSLASSDLSDGNDLLAKLAARAAQLGIVVVAAVGNDGTSAHVPTPAAGVGVLAVGAYDAQRTPECEDDRFASFSNKGPRTNNGDGSTLDELKPDLVAPGVAILSADGKLTSDGQQYKRLSGTSMSTAFVSGAAACLLSEFPALTPAAVADLLHRSARREMNAVPVAAPGSDTRWQAAIGYGALDLYAARLELVQTSHTQFERIELAAGDDTVRAVIRTQRERGAARIVLERAIDAGGTPGAFVPVDSLTAAGDSSLTGAVNRRAYVFARGVPAPERGAAFWYRAACSESGVRWTSAARRFASPSGAPVATVSFTIAHNNYDHDLTGAIEVHDRTKPSGPTYAIALPGTSAADSTDFVSGSSSTGTDLWHLHVSFTDPAIAALLPPSADHLWILRLNEAGYLNTAGRLTGLTLTWHAPGGDQNFIGGPLPVATLERGEVDASIPWGVASVAPESADRGIAFGPSPTSAGASVRFIDGRGLARELRVYDLAGREVGHAAFTGAGGSRFALWSARDPRGFALASGVYLARVDTGRAVRVVVLGQ